MAKLIWADTALRDFEAILLHIEADAPMAAKRFAQKTIDKVGLLEHHPLLGEVVPEDDACRYRQVLLGNYRIIYRVEDNAVFLVAMHHAARLLDTDRLA